MEIQKFMTCVGEIAYGRRAPDYVNSSQIIGARVLSSHGVSTAEEAPAPELSSKEKESTPAAAGGRYIECSKKPCGGGGKSAGSIWEKLDCEGVAA